MRPGGRALFVQTLHFSPSGQKGAAQKPISVHRLRVHSITRARERQARNGGGKARCSPFAQKFLPASRKVLPPCHSFSLPARGEYSIMKRTERAEGDLACARKQRRCSRERLRGQGRGGALLSGRYAACAGGALAPATPAKSRLVYMDPPFLTGEPLRHARPRRRGGLEGGEGLARAARVQRRSGAGRLLRDDAPRAGGLPQPPARGRHALSALRFSRLGPPAPDHGRHLRRKEPLKRDRLGLPHRRHGAALFQPQARYHPLLPQDGASTISTSTPCSARPRSRGRTTCAATSTPMAASTAPSAPAAASTPITTTIPCRPRTCGTTSATCNSATRSAPATTRKNRWRCLSASCAAPPARANWSLIPSPVRAPRSKPPARARPPLPGRGQVPAGAQHTAPPPRRRAVGAAAARAEWPTAPCEVDVLRGVGFYHLDASRNRPCRGRCSTTGRWAICAARRCACLRRRRARRSVPELPRELEVPVYDGEVGLRLSDVRGKSYYYRIAYEKN